MCAIMLATSDKKPDTDPHPVPLHHAALLSNNFRLGRSVER